MEYIYFLLLTIGNAGRPGCEQKTASEGAREGASFSYTSDINSSYLVGGSLLNDRLPWIFPVSGLEEPPIFLHV